MATTYGNTVNGRWCAYMNWSTSSSNTQTTLTVECCLQVNNYSVSYNNVTGDVSIDFSVNKSAQKSINKSYGAGTTYYSFCSASKTFTRGKSASDKAFSAGVTFGAGSSNWAGSSRAYGTLTVQPKPSYKVSYNANGGSGAPGAQTKWYGENLTLSSTKPTRTGYTFQGWATSSGGSVAYASGASYTANASVTLYAVWKANTWTISYNANGGSGAPGAQTKTYGVTLKLSSTRPTRTNYNFLGWATSSTATSAQYQPGGSFTANATTTLYAVWQLAYVAPRITNLAANRCNSAGTYTEDGTYAKIIFNWATDRSIAAGAVKIVCNGTTYTASGTSGTSGSVSHVVGAGALSTENSYTVTVTVTDSGGSSTSATTVAPLNYIMDFSLQGGIGVGRPAPNTPHLDVSVPLTPFGGTHFIGAIGDQDGVGNEWFKIGTYNSSNVQGQSAIIKVYGGAGQNAEGNVQNKYLQIFILDSFDQSGYFGVLVDLYGFNYGDVEVMVLATSYSQCDVWIKFDHPYERSYYSVEMAGTWSPGNATIGQTNTPTGGTSCTVYYNQVIKANENKSIYTPGHIFLPNNGAIGGTLTSGGTSAMLRMNTSNQVELNWTSAGLRGRVMKQIWSGTWNTGSITVSELPYYHMIAFTTVANAPYLLGIGLRIPGSWHWTLFNVNARTDDGLVFNAINAVQNNTTLTMSKNAHAIWRASSSIVSNGTDGTVYRIYGVL